MCSQRAAGKRDKSTHELTSMSCWAFPAWVFPLQIQIPKIFPQKGKSLAFQRRRTANVLQKHQSISIFQHLAVHLAPPLPHWTFPALSEQRSCQEKPQRLLEKLTLAVLSLEAVMNMVMSREVWMSLICLVCSLIFDSCSPDCRARGIFRELGRDSLLQNNLEIVE